MPSPTVLIIGYVWPETNASAAGLRDWALMEQFRAAGWSVHYASPAKPNPFSEKLEALGVPTFSCEANDPRFDTFVGALNPDYVVFDRFLIEEQFGWRVEDVCPNAVRVTDTVDLHFLRRAREAAVAAGWSPDRIQEADDSMIEQFSQEDCLRELSSIYRSDLTLMVSSFEMHLLKERYKIPPSQILLQRLSYKSPTPKELPSFEDRRHFVSIGNFRHPPNADAVRWMKREIWPLIRARMPSTEIHLYGAYPSREMMALTDVKAGFIVQGQADDQYATLRRYRVLLAPLRFGAGIKGKISDAWSVGTAVVTTPIGAEGMTDRDSMNSPGASASWPFDVSDTAQALADAACELYTSHARWEAQQHAGFSAIQRFYNPVSNARILIQSLEQLRTELPERRRENRVGAMLRQNLHRSTKYLSRWIELKNSQTPALGGTPVA